MLITEQNLVECDDYDSERPSIHGFTSSLSICDVTDRQKTLHSKLLMFYVVTDIVLANKTHRETDRKTEKENSSCRGAAIWLVQCQQV